jgi:aldose 1-epimerase
VVRLPDIASYENLEVNRFRLGATLGRFARSIEGARFRLDGIEYKLDKNHGRHHFHGGTFGFDRFVWEGEIRDDSPFPSIRLRLNRPDGDQGYPGMVSVEAHFTVMEASLVIEYRGTTTAPTIFGLCNHIFWNLSREHHGQDQMLTINADTVLRNDKELMPQGVPFDVTDTRFDFRAARCLSGGELDNCFPLNDSAWACLLEAPHGDVRMHVQTNQPALAGFAASTCAGGRGGVCIQLTDWPNAPNRPDFPSARLDTGTSYYNHTTYEFLWGPPACRF